MMTSSERPMAIGLQRTRGTTGNLLKLIDIMAQMQPLLEDLVKKIIKRRDGGNKEEAMKHWESGWNVVRISQEEEEEAESQFVPVYDDCSPPPTKKKRTEYDPEEPSSEVVMKGTVYTSRTRSCGPFVRGRRSHFVVPGDN